MPAEPGKSSTALDVGGKAVLPDAAPVVVVLVLMLGTIGTGGGAEREDLIEVVLTSGAAPVSELEVILTAEDDSGAEDTGAEDTGVEDAETEDAEAEEDAERVVRMVLVGPAEEEVPADGVSVSTTVTGCGVLVADGAVTRLVTVPCEGADGVSVCTTVVSSIWLSAAGRNRVCVEACATAVSMYVVGARVDCTPGRVLPTTGSQAPELRAPPSCSTIVG